MLSLRPRCSSIVYARALARRIVTHVSPLLCTLSCSSSSKERGLASLVSLAKGDEGIQPFTVSLQHLDNPIQQLDSFVQYLTVEKEHPALDRSYPTAVLDRQSYYNHITITQQPLTINYNHITITP